LKYLSIKNARKELGDETFARRYGKENERSVGKLD
jgi:hypothetical protein